MAATKNQINDWVNKGKENKCTHVIIAVDTWDHEDYPIYVTSEKNIHTEISKFERSKNRIMEIYKMSEDLEMQLNQYRSYTI
jgi:hypothetical protein